MRRKAIMVDVDGVLVAHPDAGGWSANLERDLGLSIADLQRAFFEPHWDDVVHGRAALRPRLTAALAGLSSPVTCDDLIAYWFANDAHVDHALLDELAMLRGKGLEVHLATVQEHERARHLWERLAFRDSFDGLHYAAALGVAKPDPAFYRSIEAATGLAPDAIFFIDDRIENVAGARDCGWTAAVWTGRDDVRTLMAEQNWDAG